MVLCLISPPSQEAWEPEAESLPCMASVGENNLQPLPAEDLGEGHHLTQI